MLHVCLCEGVNSPRTGDRCSGGLPCVWLTLLNVKGLCLFSETGFLYSPGCPGTQFVDQADLELRNLPAPASQSAGIKGMCHHCPTILVFFCFVFWFGLVFRDRVSLYSPGCPGTQAGLQLRNSPASASRVLGLKACATMPGRFHYLDN